MLFFGKGKRSCLFLLEEQYYGDPVTCAPVAQLAEHRAAMWEVMSSTPAGPTLRVLKLLRRKCCLCNDIRKWLDFQVFSDKDYKP